MHTCISVCLDYHLHDDRCWGCSPGTLSSLWSNGNLFDDLVATYVYLNESQWLDLNYAGCVYPTIVTIAAFLFCPYPFSKSVFFARGGYSSSSRAGRLGRTLWPQNSTSVAETEKGGQNSTMTPPTIEKGVNILHQYEKSAKKGGQKSTILKNIGVKILQVWKWGSKFYMLKNRGQNSTMLEKRGSIFYIRPQK